MCERTREGMIEKERVRDRGRESEKESGRERREWERGYRKKRTRKAKERE